VRRACIDIGSNTTRLLVADDAGSGLVVVCEERAYTRIGGALARSHQISAAKCAEVIEVVAGQLELARAQGAEEVHGVATEAIRRAVNGAELLAQLRGRTGLAIRILSGGEEARLAFRGATGMLPTTPAQWLGVLDVGGGSSEVVIARPGEEITWWVSLALGSGTLSATHLHHDPPTAGELTAARAEVAAVTARVAWDGPPAGLVLAVGGSATSLCRLTGAARLDAGAFARALAMLTAQPARRIAAEHDIDPVRARLLPAGLLILESLVARLGGGVEIVRGGIREGVLLEALARRR
jgi:exopolyphosphatase/guanosine-5'-triphosphate,3'-diphosphate pyrophosphatase